MNNISAAFKNGKAFIPFLTAGDPNIEVTEKIIDVMSKSGADLIEIGIPFSDPVAEGETIEKASIRALASGTTTDKVFEMVKRIRKKNNIPLAFMTYANVIFGYGAEKFFSESKACDICCFILPDIPFEEKAEFEEFSKKYDIKLISLIAPTSNERIVKIAEKAEGFLYCVSSLGVTGVRSEISTDIASMIKLAKSANDIPCAIGFGISTPEQAEKISKLGDGVIVGSAIVKIIEERGENAPEYISEYVRTMKNAVSSNI